MFLSIIVPAYNVEQYIGKCIDSLLNQNISDYEIIIINDVSTDRTLKIIEKYRNTKIIKIKMQQNSGLSTVRNEGIKAAKGDYLFFVDSDDYIENNCLQKLQEMIKSFKEPDVLYFGHYKHRGSEIQPLYTYVGSSNKKYQAASFLEQELSKRSIPVPACFALYRRTFIVDNKLFFEKGILHEDELWSPNVLLQAKTLATIDICVYHYVIREQSITQKKDKTQNGIDLLYVCKTLHSKVPQLIQNQKLIELMNNHIAMLYMKAICIGKLYRKDYRKSIDRRFPIQNVCFVKDGLKALVFLCSLRFYATLDARYGKKL